MTGRSRPLIVINADDLGRSESVNRAILEAFDRGSITDASIMANMPLFDQAVSGVIARGLEERVGVHLNFTEGCPLTTSVGQIPGWIAADRSFAPRGPVRWQLSALEARAIETEFEAQIGAVREAGLRPTHLDSHQHVHTQWPIASIVMRLARRHGIRAIRLSRTCGPNPGVAKAAYKTILNARLRSAGLAPTRHFGSARDVLELDRLENAVEIMVHPDVDPAGRLIDRNTYGRPGAPEALDSTAESWARLGSLVSYGELLEATRASS